jgi:hypothetical protein
MSDKIQKRIEREEIPWGEDVHAIWKESGGSGPLARRAGEKVFADYALALRREFEGNETAREILESSVPAASAKEMIVEALSHLAREESKDVFEKAVAFVLEELDRLRKQPPSLYIVDTKTGRSAIPLGENGIYQPPDFVDEGGNLRRARPIVHPGISSSLALAEAAANRMAEVEEAAASSPLAKMAFEHLTDQDSVARTANEFLRKSGVGACEDGEEILIEFGHESVAGPLQSPNVAFHRRELLGRILTNKVIEKLCGPGEASVVEVSKGGGAKRQWWKARVLARRVPALRA